MTNPTSTLDLLTYVIDANGVAHGDLFCPEAPADGTGTWVTLPYGTPPVDGCSCAAFALPPLRAEGFADVTGPSQDAPDFSGTGTGQPATTRPMTEKQEAFIQRLLTETGTAPEAVGFRPDLGSKAASAVIDKLLGIKDHQPAPVADEAPAPTTGFDFAAAAEALGRKFTAEDLTADLRAYALSYATNYAGDFSFMVDMRDAARKGRLSDGMAKGVLNCARADLARKAPAADAPTADVPEGRYAYTGTEGHTVFAKVDRPTEGRWAGYVFVKLLLGGGGNGTLVEERTSKAQAAGMLAAITDQGITECGIRFGQETGTCGRCGRGLTNEASRAAGIGPECAKKA